MSLHFAFSVLALVQVLQVLYFLCQRHTGNSSVQAAYLLFNPLKACAHHWVYAESFMPLTISAMVIGLDVVPWWGIW